ncbi:PAS domain-containing sensor histidine kinase [Ktedonobacter racemifer]|uniref:histidine kinase n=1 Tax=Ktedonobacter racemifer DSM 44963 TaxID=485913 RepID=D6U353_KTERA|nr:PAS domain-containing sensor histidine kinase [Ktedonobacter racemifer]EFH81057.1 PAS/PAC sensor signal transduction histidine kinase [Ktedonobacter racemifer DSM 44963]
MSNAKQTRRVTPGSRETLPDALFVVDDTETIVYANASAQAITGTTPEELRRNSFWRCVPRLVSTPLYQAVQKAKQTREPTEVEYVSPVTNTWLHVSLSPTDEGLALLFQENLEPPHFQDALSRNEQMYRDLLESFSDGVTIVTPDGLVLDINQRPLADAHLRREQVVGTPLTDLPAWSSDPAVQEHLRAAIARAARGETVRFEAKIHPRLDLSLAILMTITAHRDASQQVEYLICAGRDITERKHAEDELRTLVDALPQLVWIARPDGYVTYHNQRLIDYMAMTLEQAEGDGWLASVHPDDRQRVRAAWQTSIQTGVPYEVELRLQDGTSGAYRWFLVRGMPQRNAQGTILHWVGTCTDIDDQKRAEQRIKESEENWRVLAETVPQLVWTTRPDGRVDYCNQRYCDLTQADFEQLRDYRWRQFLHPEDAERALTLRQQSLATGELFENEQRLRDGQTGRYRWFLARALPVRDEAGQIDKWFGTCTDIDDQKRMEEALRESQERVNILMNSSIIGIFLAEEEQIVDVNDTYLRMTGYTREDLQAGNINWMRMTPPKYLARTQQARQELVVQQYGTPYEKEYVCKDGSLLPVVVGVVALRRDPLHTIGFVLDNSARKELEQRKDDFISMASHELRNPLAALKMQIQLVRKRLERQSHHEAATALSRVEGPVKQLERLIGELLDVSKIQAGRLEYLQETVDLDALLHEVADTMQQLSTTHTIVVRGAAPRVLVGDKDRLGQVFTNLLSNAIKYSPGAETVEMDLSASEETVTVRVHDHGLGIPREQRDKIFERFYRVAGPKQKAIPGLGMGLYIVAEIVKHHGGTLTVDSAVGKGSTFTVTLPCKRDA